MINGKALEAIDQLVLAASESPNIKEHHIQIGFPELIREHLFLLSHYSALALNIGSDSDPMAIRKTVHKFNDATDRLNKALALYESDSKVGMCGSTTTAQSIE